MSQKMLEKGCLAAVVLYVLLAAAFYFICGEQLHYRYVQTDMLSASDIIGEITADVTVTQRAAVDGDRLLGLTLYSATYGRRNTGILRVEVCDGERLLASKDVDISGLADNSTFYAAFDTPVPLPGKLVELRITAPESTPGNAVTLYSGNTISTARNQVDAGLREDEFCRVNGAALDTALCFQLRSQEELWFGAYYWQIMCVGLALLCCGCWYLLRKNKAGEPTLVINMFTAFSRYHYLIQQLVARDFKSKYKRSVLGVLWSFLNPMLTMSVQYVIFSTLFRSDIPNFVVYLLSGIVCFNFFSEATSMTLTSIVSNAALITKVYVPKYIYPLTRVMSSTVNFLLALIPLLAMLLVTRTPITPAVLLLPIGVVCLFALCLGVGLLLAASMVFFRDTQFLWNVVSMLWMYATPIFYPESIVPSNMMALYKCNPLYHIIRFIRTILMEGISPEPKAYALMLIAALVPLALGVTVFMKTQDEFVLNI